MNIVEKILREKTSNMFSDSFYESVSNKIIKEVTNTDNKKGFVYFIKNGLGSKHVKVGMAINLDNRLTSYQTAFSNDIYLVGYIECENYISLEKEIHSYLSDKRVKGEWFSLDANDFFDISTQYDFKQVNNFYNGDYKTIETSIKESKENVDVFEFARNLQKDKIYNTAKLFTEFKKTSSKYNDLNTSWFGRLLSKSFRHLGYSKKDIIISGVRHFVLK